MAKLSLSETEQTLVLIKPDGLSKSLTGNILTRLSETKLEIAAAKVLRVSRKLAEEHYKALRTKPFFEELIKYIMGDYHPRKKVMAMVYVGKDAIKKVREISGATNPEEADNVTIRGQYGRITTKGVYENVIHASATLQEAEREIKLWFEPDEIIYDLYATKPIEKTVKKPAWATPADAVPVVATQSPAKEI
ncbi:MAG: nucleoside-diphosphate kinase [Candidatus Omnitrophica bacterium]|nr:nucleoside-diphosphate kinase [Candidatus Omnitrophota bacterium]